VSIVIQLMHNRKEPETKTASDSQYRQVCKMVHYPVSTLHTPCVDEVHKLCRERIAGSEAWSLTGHDLSELIEDTVPLWIGKPPS